MVYLAIQIRQNTASLRANNLREVIHSVATSYDRMTADPRDLTIYLKGRESSASLSLEERERFWVLLAMQLGNCELIVDLNRNGLVKPGTYNAALRQLVVLLSKRGARELWEERKSLFADDFRAFVDSQLAACETAA